MLDPDDEYGMDVRESSGIRKTAACCHRRLRNFRRNGTLRRLYVVEYTPVTPGTPDGYRRAPCHSLMTCPFLESVWAWTNSDLMEVIVEAFYVYKYKIK